jgi:hypothetical protein
LFSLVSATTLVASAATIRVTVAAAELVPRLLTCTEKVTAEPTDGFAGVDVTLSTCRSGPGAWPTTSCDDAVKVLLALFCSATVSAGSTTADT